MYLAGTGAVMEAGLVIRAETAAVAVPSGLAGATELLASTTACERPAATIRACVMTSAQPGPAAGAVPLWLCTASGYHTA